MASNIENLAEKTAKLSIDPVYDTNWCDMPADIKLECIGKMELNERLSLRCTAKAEKSLVESQKMNFVEGKFIWKFISVLTVLLKTEKGILHYRKEFFDKTEARDFMRCILKIGNFENFKFTYSHFFAELCANSDIKISAKNIDFLHTSCEDMLFVLEKAKSGVESIEISPKYEELKEKDFPMEKFLESPKIQNARYWHNKESNQPQLLTELAKIWIDKNSKIGSTFLTSLTVDGASQHFLNTFKNRILSVSDERIRIRTENPAAHILLERGLAETGNWDSSYQFFRLSIISAGMKESDYEENHTEWIRKMYPELGRLNIIGGPTWQ